MNLLTNYTAITEFMSRFVPNNDGEEFSRCFNSSNENGFVFSAILPLLNDDLIMPGLLPLIVRTSYPTKCRSKILMKQM